MGVCHSPLIGLIMKIRLMLRCFLVVVLGTYSMGSRACADYDCNGGYYCIFNQMLVGDPTLYPFLLTMEPGFYYTEDGERLPDPNIGAWEEFLKQDPLLNRQEHLSELVYRYSLTELEGVATGRNLAYGNLWLSSRGKAMLQYLKFAKTVEPYANLDNEDRWELKRKELPDDLYENLVREGTTLLLQTSYPELRLRYGYQLVRLAHYVGCWEDALSFFDLYVERYDHRHPIYFYALEHKAGVLYEDGQEDEAAYLFSRVFEQLPARRESAMISFSWCRKDFDVVLSFCQDAGEKAVLYAMRGYDDFTDEVAEAEHIFEIDPASPYIELMMIRSLNKYERLRLEEVSWYWSLKEEDSPGFMSKDLRDDPFFLRNVELSDRMIASPLVKREGFWKVYRAHLAFLAGEYEQAEQFLAGVEDADPAVQRQINKTRFATHLAGLPHVEPGEAAELMAYGKRMGVDEEYVREVLGGKYKAQGDLASSFLMHNDLVDLRSNPDPVIADALIDYYAALGGYEEGICFLNRVKGMYYWRLDSLEKAMEFYDKVGDGGCGNENEEDGVVPGLIFSNRMEMAFDLPAERVMTDEVFREAEFSFIGEQMSEKALLGALVRLKEMAREESETGARASYLLGNYYLNVSAHGYFRNIPFLDYDGNYYYSDRYPAAQTELEQEDFSRRYNYKYYGCFVMVYNRLDVPLEYYRRVLEGTSDRELKARALYMSAQCATDLAGDSYSEYYAKTPLAERAAYPYFTRLIEEFDDTQFYEEAVSRCKYLDFYVQAY